MRSFLFSLQENKLLLIIEILLCVLDSIASRCKISDQYREPLDAREREGAITTGSLPKSVTLVGHSIGGFVARDAVTLPLLRKLAVETMLTLSRPHQSPPLALQPSLGLYFREVNGNWRKGYEAHTTPTGHTVSDPGLSHVVVVSITGEYEDYQFETDNSRIELVELVFYCANKCHTVGTNFCCTVAGHLNHMVDGFPRVSCECIMPCVPLCASVTIV